MFLAYQWVSDGDNGVGRGLHYTPTRQHRGMEAWMKSVGAIECCFGFQFTFFGLGGMKNGIPLVLRVRKAKVIGGWKTITHF